jgi:hypothetical protein
VIAWGYDASCSRHHLLFRQRLAADVSLLPSTIARDSPTGFRKRPERLGASGISAFASIVLIPSLLVARVPFVAPRSEWLMATAARLHASPRVFTRHRARAFDRQQVAFQAGLSAGALVRDWRRGDKHRFIVERVTPQASLVRRSLPVIVRQRPQLTQMAAKAV